MPPPLKFLLTPIGSAGDVHPFIWLGKLLRARGHDVLCIAQAGVSDMPQRAGLPTVPWGDKAEQEAIIRNPDIWHPRKALDLITHFAAAWAQENLAVIRRHVEPGRTVIIHGALAFGARVLAEKTGVPLLTAHVQPAVLMSVDDSPVMMAHMEWLPRAPRFVRRAFFALGNRMVDRKMGPAVDAIRHAQGLTGRTKNLMRHYWHSPDGVLCLFPNWYAPKQRDWPPQALTTRFPLYDEAEDRPQDPALETFMRAGEPPVIITPGSANAHAAMFIRQAVAGCASAGRRALVITQFPEQAGTLPTASACFAYVPFGQVFSRAAAVVHHGGVGTTAQCLAAGVPQLIMPMAHDQPDNASRVRRMGVGEYLYPARFKARAIGAKLRALMESAAVGEACQRVQRQMQAQMSAREVGVIVEEMSHRALTDNRTP